MITALCELCGAPYADESQICDECVADPKRMRERITVLRRQHYQDRRQIAEMTDAEERGGGRSPSLPASVTSVGVAPNGDLIMHVAVKPPTPPAFVKLDVPHSHSNDGPSEPSARAPDPAARLAAIRERDRARVQARRVHHVA